MGRSGSRTHINYYQKRFYVCRFHCPSFDVKVEFRINWPGRSRDRALDPAQREK